MLSGINLVYHSAHPSPHHLQVWVLWKDVSTIYLLLTVMVVSLTVCEPCGCQILNGRHLQCLYWVTQALVMERGM